MKNSLRLRVLALPPPEKLNHSTPCRELSPRVTTSAKEFSLELNCSRGYHGSQAEHCVAFYSERLHVVHACIFPREPRSGKEISKADGGEAILTFMLRPDEDCAGDDLARAAVDGTADQTLLNPVKPTGND
jgi:hypothetical protein